MIVSLIEPSVLRLRAVWGFCCVDGLRMVVTATAEPGRPAPGGGYSLIWAI